MRDRQARRPLLRGVVALVGLLTSLSACTGPEPQPPPAKPAVSVRLSADIPENLSIGVVVSETSAPAEGSQWRQAAEGAEVAADRFARGNTKVTLVPVNDKGTAAGASAAIQQLVDRKVAGVVLATSGRHVQDALQEAADHNLPVLLPYATTTENFPDRAWLTGAEATVTDQRIVATLQQENLRRLYLIDAGGGQIDGLTPVASRTFAIGDDAGQLARVLATAQRKRADAFDSVVITGPAELQGRLVAALQGAGIETPIALSPDALSPAFPQAIGRADGSLSGTFLTAGLDEGDARALEPTDAGRAAAAYFSAVSLAASDPKAMDLFGQQLFRTVAVTADLRSHDAVVSIVRAAAAARSNDPAQVARALAGRKLGVADGIAGPVLDFSTPAAVSGDGVRALAATSVSPGVRPTPVSSSTLYWYAAEPT